MVSRWDPEVLPQLRAFGLERLESTSDVALAAWQDGRLAYVNPAWVSFARENQAPQLAAAPPIGRDIYEVIAEQLRPFYRRGWEAVLAAHEVWPHRYECSTPELLREYLMLTYPLHGPPPALLQVHSLVVSAAHDREAVVPVEVAYRDLHGIITQCASCRRVQHPHSADRWDWVPEWVEQAPELTSHGVCGPCLEHYYR